MQAGERKFQKPMVHVKQALDSDGRLDTRVVGWAVALQSRKRRIVRIYRVRHTKTHPGDKILAFNTNVAGCGFILWGICYLLQPRYLIRE